MENNDRITFRGALMHFKTITKHRHIVRRNCFKMGLYFQGLTHDLSKYSPSEFWNGARYYQGTRSPNTRERELFGYSRTWLHHKGRNKHHFEYWIDFFKMGGPDSDGIVPCPMPNKYVAEMIADRVAACMTYRGAEYDSWDAWKYYQKEKPVLKKLVHPDTLNKLEFFLDMLGNQGEAATFKYIKEIFLTGKDKGRWERELEESLN
ncbi:MULTISPECIES: DUF5662 family protein [unclassified Butyrivibrio]|uniref:DUF5662 family protein n=1 Tax=unclassified Butyrivibrio TaxID=2639466 RepID=UPI0003B3FE6C|nr:MULTISPECIES: DUF5662 family protein [unclassified Butyrivibrio]